MQKKAVALAYDEYKEGIPKILATGKGNIAQSIITKAQEHDISIFENKQLADALVNYELNTFIAPELYESVAKVLAWLNDVNQSKD